MSISRNINLVGNASMKSIKYFNDFDLNQLFERAKVSEYTAKILQMFQNEYKEAYNNTKRVYH